MYNREWNNHIFIGDKGFIYPNVAASDNNNLFFLSSSYPGSNNRKLFILNKECYGIVNKNSFLE